MIEIGYPKNQEFGIVAGTGAAGTAGGTITGQVGTGTGIDAQIAAQSTDPLSSTSADATTPESQQQYDLRTLSNRLPPKQIYAVPNVWGDMAYWLDS